MPKAEHNTWNYKNVCHQGIKNYDKQHHSTLVKKKHVGGHWTYVRGRSRRHEDLLLYVTSALLPASACLMGAPMAGRIRCKIISVI